MNDDRQDPALRVSLKESDVQELMRTFTKLSRTEIVDVITRAGPMRAAVEAELRGLSDLKS